MGRGLERAVELMIETGTSFAVGDGSRWMNHKVAMDHDFLLAHIDSPALEKWETLRLSQKMLLVRAVTELSVAKFRKTRKDPAYEPSETEVWKQLITRLLGDEGLERLGL